jgi:hypothetical protein
MAEWAASGAGDGDKARGVLGEGGEVAGVSGEDDGVGAG